jgi:TPR repeat protein
MCELHRPVLPGSKSRLKRSKGTPFKYYPGIQELQERPLRKLSESHNFIDIHVFNKTTIWTILIMVKCVGPHSIVAELISSSFQDLPPNNDFVKTANLVANLVCKACRKSGKVKFGPLLGVIARDSTGFTGRIVEFILCKCIVASQTLLPMTRQAAALIRPFRYLMHKARMLIYCCKESLNTIRKHAISISTLTLSAMASAHSEVYTFENAVAHTIWDACQYNDRSQALRWLHLSATQGNANSQRALVDIFSWGFQGLPKDRERQMQWNLVLAQGGDATAQFEVGMHLKATSPRKCIDPEAIHWLELSAAQGYLQAYYWLGKIHNNVLLYNSSADTKKGVQWLRSAALQGHQDSQFELMLVCYCQLHDYIETVHWINTLLTSTCYGTIAKRYLVEYLFGGKGIAKSPAEAMRIVTLAAARHEAWAHHELGVCYETGRGVDRNMEEASRWYNLATSQQYYKV